MQNMALRPERNQYMKSQSVIFQDSFRHHSLSTLILSALLSRKDKTDFEGNLMQEDFDKYVAKEPFEKGYYCTLCQMFRKRGIPDVRNHIESKHFPNTFSYNCELCDAALGTATALKRHHQRVHQ